MAIRREWLKTEKGKAYTAKCNQLYNTDINKRLQRYKAAARNRNFVWALTDEKAKEMFRSVCHYCHIPANPLNGIDRKDNDQGYMDSNCVACCAECNMAKLKTPYEKFQAWIDRLVAARSLPMTRTSDGIP